MKVVITGGTGLIGRALAKSLLADRHEVVILSRDPESAKHVPQGANVVKWDGHSAEGWVEAAEAADAIVNLAGASIDSRWTDAYKKRIRESRVKAGQAVVAGIKAMDNKPKALIQASAVGYYGVQKDNIITEDSPAGNDFLAGVCKDWEASSQEAEALGVRRAIIRTGIVLSTKGGALARLLPIFRLGAGGPVGSGKQYYPWIHIGDEVDAIRFLIETPSASGVFNLSAPNPVPNADFSRTLGRAMNRPAFAPAPAIAMKVAFGEMATIILDGQRAIPQNLQKAGYTFRHPELEAAFRHLLFSGFEGE
jgi:uncharacterized protein (TIGR01777 family)